MGRDDSGVSLYSTPSYAEKSVPKWHSFVLDGTTKQCCGLLFMEAKQFDSLIKCQVGKRFYPANFTGTKAKKDVTTFYHEFFLGKMFFLEPSYCKCTLVVARIPVWG